MTDSQDLIPPVCQTCGAGLSGGAPVRVQALAGTVWICSACLAGTHPEAAPAGGTCSLCHTPGPVVPLGARGARSCRTCTGVLRELHEAILRRAGRPVPAI